MMELEKKELHRKSIRSLTNINFDEEDYEALYKTCCLLNNGSVKLVLKTYCMCNELTGADTEFLNSVGEVRRLVKKSLFV